MREIKFRCWDKKNKKWIINYIPKAGWVNFNIDNGILNLTPNGDTELMQFTGLLDKNGKEIFEGDVMKNGGIIFEVYWNEHNGNWARKNISELLAGETMKASEVIGNRFENPELLK